MKNTTGKTPTAKTKAKMTAAKDQLAILQEMQDPANTWKTGMMSMMLLSNHFANAPGKNDDSERCRALGLCLATLTKHIVNDSINDVILAFVDFLEALDTAGAKAVQQ